MAAKPKGSPPVLPVRVQPWHQSGLAASGTGLGSVFVCRTSLTEGATMAQVVLVLLCIFHHSSPTERVGISAAACPGRALEHC